MILFQLLEQLATLQNSIRYMILDILSGSTDFKWNKHALNRKLWEAETCADLVHKYLTFLFL